MAWKIWKYPFPIKDEFELEMPIIAQILKVDVQQGLPCLWVLVETDTVNMTYKFRLFGTGHPIPGGPLWSKPPLRTVKIQQNDGSILEYFDTFMMRPFVWHLFQVHKGRKTTVTKFGTGGSMELHSKSDYDSAPRGISHDLLEIDINTPSEEE